jgi:hypothetical protein
MGLLKFLFGLFAITAIVIYAGIVNGLFKINIVVGILSLIPGGLIIFLLVKLARWKGRREQKKNEQYRESIAPQTAHQVAHGKLIFRSGHYHSYFMKAYRLSGIMLDTSDYNKLLDFRYRPDKYGVLGLTTPNVHSSISLICGNAQISSITYSSLEQRMCLSVYQGPSVSKYMDEKSSKSKPDHAYKMFLKHMRKADVLYCDDSRLTEDEIDKWFKKSWFE